MEIPNPELKFIRMVTGEDLISQVIRKKLENGDVYLLLKPLKINYMMSETGKIGVSLYQWIFQNISETQEFPVFSSDIITMGVPSSQISKYYWEILKKETKPMLEEEEFISSEDFNNEEDTFSDDDEEDLEEVFANFKSKKTVH